MNIKKTSAIIIFTLMTLASCSKAPEHISENDNSHAEHTIKILQDIIRIENAYNTTDVNAVTNELIVATRIQIKSDADLPNKALKIAAKLRQLEEIMTEFKPETQEVTNIHLGALESLRRIAILNDYLAALTESVKTDLAQANSILRLDKSEIRNRRNELINIKHDLSRLEGELNNTLEELDSAGITFNMTLAQIVELAKHQQKILDENALH